MENIAGISKNIKKLLKKKTSNIFFCLYPEDKLNRKMDKKLERYDKLCVRSVVGSNGLGVDFWTGLMGVFCVFFSPTANGIGGNKANSLNAGSMSSAGAGEGTEKTQGVAQGGSGQAASGTNSAPTGNPNPKGQREPRNRRGGVGGSKHQGKGGSNATAAPSAGGDDLSAAPGAKSAAPESNHIINGAA